MDLRIGKVTAVSNGAARVRFEDDGFTSGWLRIISAPPDVSVDVDVSVTGGGSDSSDSPVSPSGGEDDVTAKASTTAKVTAWVPTIGQTVLCAYGEGFNADGFILGGL